MEIVDERGEGRQLVPLDAEMAAEFEERGASFVVRSTVQDLERDLDSSYDWHRFEQEIGQEQDRGPEQGYER